MCKDAQQAERETAFKTPWDTGVNWEQFGGTREHSEAVHTVSPMMVPDLALKLDDQVREPYEEKRRTETAKSQMFSWKRSDDGW